LTPAASGYAFNELCTFDEGDGDMPSSPLVAGANGVLYGQTLYGGPNEGGIVYQLTPASSGYTVHVIHRFLRRPGGLNPYGPLVLKNGALFGTASSGGDFTSDGTVFEIGL
jgi:uncharacterized repeat protein (TIGR03803 family)